VLAALRKVIQDKGLYDQDSPKKSEHTALLQYGFYKLFLSSPEACCQTVVNRLEKLESNETGMVEASILQKLADRLKKLSLKDSARYQLLKKELNEMAWDGTANSPRVLVFTEYRRTQEALSRVLAKDFKLNYSDKFDKQYEQPIAVIHGSTPDIHLSDPPESLGMFAFWRKIGDRSTEGHRFDVHNGESFSTWRKTISPRCCWIMALKSCSMRRLPS